MTERTALVAGFSVMFGVTLGAFYQELFGWGWQELVVAILVLAVLFGGSVQALRWRVKA